MARFVMAGNRSGPSGDGSRQLVEAAYRRLFPASSRITEQAPQTKRYRLLFECEATEVASKVRELPTGISVEPEILHTPATPLEVFVQSETGQPIEHVRVVAVLESTAAQVESEGLSDARGCFRVVVADGFQASFVSATPASDYWWSWDHVASRSVVVLRCDSLPTGPIGWWHEAVGAHGVDLRRGSGIRVGVIDTGISRHACLPYVIRVGTFQEGEIHSYRPNLGYELHGTHVAGLIGALPIRASSFVGIAPAVELYSADVFHSKMQAGQIDLANAIDLLASNHRVHLINMSFGATVPSTILHDAILDAIDEGAVCVCATGNDAGAAN